MYKIFEGISKDRLETSYEIFMRLPKTKYRGVRLLNDVYVCPLGILYRHILPPNRQLVSYIEIEELELDKFDALQFIIDNSNNKFDLKKAMGL